MYELLGVYDYDFADRNGERVTGSSLFWADDSVKDGLRGRICFKLSCPRDIDSSTLIVGESYDLVFDRFGKLRGIN